jgi:hypothetical protein
MTIAGLAERYGVQPDTIVGHLIRFQAEGGEVRPREDLHALAGTDVETTAEVFAAFAGCGHELLKPVFERLGGRVGYGQLRVLRLLYLADRS